MAHKFLSGLKAGPSAEVINDLVAKLSTWEAFNSSALL